MLGSSVSTLLLAVALAAPFPQASSSSSPTLDQQPSNPNSGNTTALVPQQLRKAQPPPANASADQLEAMGDSLREQKAYADSLDYYRAAMKKSDSAVLHDKAGIAELELLHHDDARLLRYVEVARRHVELLGIGEEHPPDVRSPRQHNPPLPRGARTTAGRPTVYPAL